VCDEQFLNKREIGHLHCSRKVCRNSSAISLVQFVVQICKILFLYEGNKVEKPQIANSLETKEISRKKIVKTKK